MLKKYINTSSFKLWKSLDHFATALERGRFFIRKDLALVFLCGANQKELVPSERRKFLKKIIERQLPSIRVVYAEAVMEELAKYGKTKNLLDIEHGISLIADKVVIILESLSSFCELGAFAHNDLRQKLIVVNNSDFKTQTSFINLGPLQAIREDIGENRILWYPMSEDGVFRLDSIGSVLPELIQILKERPRHPEVNKASCMPSSMSQAALFFLHDLIYLCGPITHVETIEIYKKIFGEQSYDNIKPLRGILHASKLITFDGDRDAIYYRSQATETFINFKAQETELIAAFRRFHFKFNSSRFVHA